MDEKGYYGKYYIERVDEKSIEGHKMFVLDLTTDESARNAALSYAVDSRNEDLFWDLIQLFEDDGCLSYNEFFEIGYDDIISANYDVGD